MQSLYEEFDDRGFVIVDKVVSVRELINITEHLNSLEPCKVGTRNVLRTTWCQTLAESLKSNELISPLLPREAVAVQCTYFEKSTDQNWLVALHRDCVIPVKARVTSSDWCSWGRKEGLIYGRPPLSVLQSLVAIRIHLEDNSEMNGPLQVIPRSHRITETMEHRTKCLVKQRGALIMSPLLLHGSSKLSSGVRRVLHFLYAPPLLPDGAEWVYAV